MTRIILTLLIALATGLGEAQTAAGVQTPAMPPTPSSAQPPAVSQSPGNSMPEVSPEAAIITIHGLCPQGADASKPDACVTSVTKAQFEEMLGMINTTGQAYSPAALKSLAQRYAEFMVLGDAATKAGVDRDPRFLEAMRVARLRNLADAYRRYLEEKFQNLPPEEIRAYYSKNLTRYEQVRLSRIFLSYNSPKYMKQGHDEFKKKVQQMAGEIRERAAQGEDMDALQKEAYAKLELGTPPPSDLGFKRHGTLPPSMEQQVASLKAGEVSKVLEEPVGVSIFKVVFRGPMPLDIVKGEIVREISKDKIDTAMKTLLGSTKTDLNEQYFKTIPPPRPAGIPGSGPARNAGPGSPSGASGAAPGFGNPAPASNSGVAPTPPTTATPK
jgi:hypothetical protein